MIWEEAFYLFYSRNFKNPEIFSWVYMSMIHFKVQKYFSRDISIGFTTSMMEYINEEKYKYIYAFLMLELMKCSIIGTRIGHLNKNWYSSLFFYWKDWNLIDHLCTLWSLRIYLELKLSFKRLQQHRKIKKAEKYYSNKECWKT